MGIQANPVPTFSASSRLRQWFDAGTAAPAGDDPRADHIDWLRALPFIALHLGCLGVFWVGASPAAVIVATGLYAIRMFALTGFYHRYFAHRTFRASRPVQFVFALLGAASAQRGPLWWAAHHRNHHRHADTEFDPHAPGVHGFLWSHMGWFLTPRAFRTNLARVSDLAKYPELRWLDRYDVTVPIALALALYAIGAGLRHVAPQWHTDGAQMLVWGFFVSTVVLFHATVTINSLAHRWGRRRFDTRDNSRNNVWLAVLTFGEGWHNNHHFFPGSARQGFRWWEIDLTWYGLKLMALLGLVHDLKPVPAWVSTKARR
ncbi:MAG: acyl-CoA desaturase [Rhodanobacteraceae bacterium]|nr:MAG: acyl-CoA desaturase [Rhodanobacteraceae bacterium]